VAISTIDDLDRLNRLIFKSFEKVISEKEKQKSTAEENNNEELMRA
jgi:hypothetical protein